MYSLLKKIITEKEMLRQISVLEQLMNHPTITTKALAQEIHTTERTLFSDLQQIRDQLPTGWQLETSNQGIRLVHDESQLANELLATFLPQSMGIQLIKALFFTKELTTTAFLNENGLSFETLKRQVAKINRQLQPYHLKIRATTKTIQLLGDESAIRIFYHRLLTPFTHNNYFFDDYTIHEEHYIQFLNNIKGSPLSVETEQIFGTCWFFINVIRIKANCRMETFSFNIEDPLFTKYEPLLIELYQQEGIYLHEVESFFAFFCFLESWNYNNTFGKDLQLADLYPDLATLATQLTEQIATPEPMSLKRTGLSENLLLLLIKYHESSWLSEQFQLEYHELLDERRDKLPNYEETQRLALLEPVLGLDNPAYFLNLVSLLAQQAFFSAYPLLLTVYFVFQGEPAWKAFLQQELSDLLGRRVQLRNLEVSEIEHTDFPVHSLIVSNIPLEHCPIEVCYLSTIPTKNELRQLTELTLEYYL